MSALRCIDRGCTCNKRKTRQIIQEDYEDINTGGRFMIEFRYSNILFVLGVTFLYSSGMPILYPIAAAYFFATYWADKILLICFTRRPIVYDSYLAMNSLNWYKYILLMHFIAGFFMFANSSILPSFELVSLRLSQKLKLRGYNKNSFTQAHIILYFVLFLLLILAYLYWKFIYNTFLSCIKKCDRYANGKEDEKVDEDIIEHDFYTCVDFKSLLLEMEYTLDLRMAYKNRAIEFANTLSAKSIEGYISSLDKKKAAIEQAIIRIANFKDTEGFKMSEKDPVTQMPQLIDELQVKDMEGKLSFSKIKDELKSYDILRNENYSRLMVYEKILNEDTGHTNFV